MASTPTAIHCLGMLAEVSPGDTITVSYSGSGQHLLETSSGSFSGGSVRCEGFRSTASSVTLTVMDSADQIVLRLAQASAEGAVNLADPITLTISAPVDCEGMWQDWDDIECSAACGGGTQTRSYTVSTPAANGGEACPEDETQDCNMNPCPVDCEGMWQDWDDIECSAACGGGTQTRSYTVSTPAANGGEACPEVETQTQDCNTDPCPEPEEDESEVEEEERCAMLLDVRTEEEWNGGHASCAHRLPVQSDEDLIEEVLPLVGADLGHPVVVYCRSGARAAEALTVLETAGFSAVTNGGGWVQLEENAAVLEAMCECWEEGGQQGEQEGEQEGAQCDFVQLVARLGGLLRSAEGDDAVERRARLLPLWRSCQAQIPDGEEEREACGGQEEREACEQGDDCGGQVFTECGTACPNICGSYARGECNRMCVAEHQCPNGGWFDSAHGGCVEAEEDCTDGITELPPGIAIGRCVSPLAPTRHP
eukprot:SAG11_NODE_4056_length_2084_cov_1.550630_1_plen_481_part_00